MTDEPELLRCPDCAGSVRMFSAAHNTRSVQPAYFVECNDCGSRSPWKKERLDAIRAWNERAGDG